MLRQSGSASWSASWRFLRSGSLCRRDGLMLACAALAARRSAASPAPFAGSAPNVVMPATSAEPRDGGTMSKLPLTFACGLYDRMLALHTGEVQVAGGD